MFDGTAGMSGIVSDFDRESIKVLLPNKGNLWFPQDEVSVL